MTNTRTVGTDLSDTAGIVTVNAAGTYLFLYSLSAAPATAGEGVVVTLEDTAGTVYAVGGSAGANGEDGDDGKRKRSCCTDGGYGASPCESLRRGDYADGGRRHRAFLGNLSVIRVG